MAAGAHSAGGRGSQAEDEHAHKRKLTPAQLYCYLAGAALLLAGIAGFFVDSSFTTGDSGSGGGGHLHHGSLIGFHVNGWHNVVHVLSGLLLLAAARKRRSAKTVALGFGVVYGIVALIGLIDGRNVLGLIPVNAADNVLHILLSLAGILAALASRTDDDVARTVGDGEGARTGRRIDSSELVRDSDHGVVDRERTAGSGERGGRFERELEPRDLNPNDGTPESTERRTL